MSLSIFLESEMEMGPSEDRLLIINIMVLLIIKYCNIILLTRFLILELEKKHDIARLQFNGNDNYTYFPCNEHGIHIYAWIPPIPRA